MQNNTATMRNISVSQCYFTKGQVIKMLDRITLTLLIIGGINWGSIGIFNFDIVGWIFGGQSALVSRIIYTVVGLCALWCISLLFRSRENIIEKE